MEISWFIAAMGGLLSFLSPCVLPLVPAYLCFITGHSYQEIRDRNQSRWAMLAPAIAFVLGFSTVFVALGAGASAIQDILQAHKDIFARISGVLIILMGLHFTGLIRFSFLYREKRFQNNPQSRRGLLGAYLIGLAFAFGWTPCIGPVLATILTLAATQTHFGQGVALLAVYSLGLGIPFILSALAVNHFLVVAKSVRRHMRGVEIIMGLGLIATGIAIFTGSLQNLGFYLIEIMPGLAKIG